MRVLSLVQGGGRLRLWRGLLLFALLVVLIAQPADFFVSAQATEEFWVDWDNTFGPESFQWGWPYGNWYLVQHNYIVPDGQRQVGWVLDVQSFTYSGQNAMADWRKSGITFGVSYANPKIGKHCLLNYQLANQPKQFPAQLGDMSGSTAAAQAKCAELASGTTWAGYKNVQLSGEPQPIGGWRQYGYSGGMTITMTPIYYGVPDGYAKFSAIPSRGPAPLTVTFHDESFGEITRWTWAFGDGTGYIAGTEEFANPPDHVYTEPGTYTVGLAVDFWDGSSDLFEMDVVVEEYIDWVRPFRAADEGYPPSYAQVSDGVLYEGYVLPGYDTHAEDPDNAVVGFSKAAGVPVHAATAATVLSITPLQSSSCDVNRAECFVLFAEDQLIFKQFNFLVNDVYKVVLEITPGQELHYLVTDPFDYISVGEPVQAGCPIGNSIPIVKQYSGLGEVSRWIVDTLKAGLGLVLDLDALNALEQQLVPFDVPEGIGFTSLLFYKTSPDPSGEGGGLVRRVVSIVNALIQHPEDEPRACAYTPSDCVSPDQEFQNPAAWVSSGQVDWALGGGVVLYPASSLSVQMALDAMTAYQVEVWAMSALSGAGSVRLQLGQTSSSFSTSEAQFTQLLIPSVTHTPDLGLEYTFAIYNAGSVPVLLKSACVSSDSTGGSAPQSCYFENPSFEGGLNGWTASEGAVPGLVPGELVMSNNSTISQMATLYPNGAATHQYLVTVIATVGFGSEQELRADLTSKVGFEWEYPAGAGFEPFTAPSSATMYEVGFFFLGYENGLTALPDNQIQFQAYVPVSTMQNSAFTIRAKIDSSNSNIKVRLREACINDPFSHHPGDEWTPPPLPVSCFTIPTPQGSEINTWLFWHWSKLDQFFQCDLMTQLNKMFELSFKTYTMLGWQARYWQSTLMMYTSWLSTDVFPWLDGHFRNMTAGNLTLVNIDEGDEGCHDLWCAIVSISDLLQNALGVVGQLLELVLMAFSLVFDIVSVLLRLVSDIFNMLLAVINQLFGLVQTLTLAWNTAEVQEIPFLPTCADPQSNALCVGVWFLENTIFGTTFGRLLIPLLLSFAVTEWLEWMFSQLKNLIAAVGEMT